MARNKSFGATNEPRTCLWCGARLVQRMDHNAEEWTKYMAEATRDSRQGKPLKDRRIRGIPTGTYGEDGDGLFCRVRCGYQFGRAMAQLGRRFKEAR